MQTENVSQETEKPAPDAATTQPQADAPVKEQEEKKPPEGYVPHGALHQERMTRRRLERDLAEERMKWETANKRLEDLAKRFAPAEAKAPDPNEDPVGGIIHETRQTRDEVAQLRKEREEEKKATAAREQQTEIERHWSSSAQAFAAKQADFPQAYEHLFRNAMEEFQEAGYDEQQATHLVQGYWKDIVIRARQDGVNPAERMYNLAKRRGYKAMKAEDKLETIEKGTTKATSPLGGSSGKAPSKLTMEALGEMKQEDFDKLSDADFRRIVNGG